MSDNFTGYAAKAVAAFVGPWLAAAVVWAVAHGFNLGIDVNAIEPAVAAVVTSVIVYLKRNKLKAIPAVLVSAGAQAVTIVEDSRGPGAAPQG